MSTNSYKTSRKYKCPYCDFKAPRNELVDHVEKKHEDVLPENYTAARAVYDFINGKNYNTCMICHTKVYEWNDKCNRYNNLCSNPKCREKVREIALERHMKVYNKPTLLNDPEQQEKMLAHRKISGTYTFTDGGKVTYTGSYEKKALEFMDKILEIPSRDIQAPGPVLEYEYGGKTHKWITDIYYIPGNLLIEVKDGGSNPNNRSMVSYREKQIAKETMVTDMGKFNYLRLTNNDFKQLLDIFADMKMEALENENPKATIHINEEVGGIPPHRPPEAYIIPYGMNNVFSGFAYGDNTSNDVIIPDSDEFTKMDYEEFNEKYDIGNKLYYTGKDSETKIKSIKEFILTDKPDPMYFARKILGNNTNSYREVLLSEDLAYSDDKVNEKINECLSNGIKMGLNTHKSNAVIISTLENVNICMAPNGYYAITPSDYSLASNYYKSMKDLKESGILEFLNSEYNNFHNGGVQ